MLDIIIIICLYAAVWILVWRVCILEKHERRLSGDVVLMKAQIRELYSAGPTTCKTCGGNVFVYPEDEWVCKECREPAPPSFASQLDNPNESRTIN